MPSDLSKGCKLTVILSQFVEKVSMCRFEPGSNQGNGFSQLAVDDMSSLACRSYNI